MILRAVFLIFILSLFKTSPIPIHRAESAETQAPCADLANGTEPINVLTLNLLFSEYAQRSQRLEEIASFMAENKVHIAALQEVVGGSLDLLLARKHKVRPVKIDTADSLRRILSRKHGLRYHLRGAFSNGVPGALNVSNSVLSLCPIQGMGRIHFLPLTEDIRVSDDLAIPLTRSALMTRIEIAGSTLLNLYNTHLCSGCPEYQRLKQAESLLHFIEKTQSRLPSAQVILAGDFNTHVPTLSAPLPALYERITLAQGFTDTYASFTLSSSGSDRFCVPNTADRGCTRGVSTIPDPFDPRPAQERIDYIFSRGPWEITESRVVFNPLSRDVAHPPGVSDHSGVLTRFMIRSHVP